MADMNSFNAEFEKNEENDIICPVKQILNK